MFISETGTTERKRSCLPRYRSGTPLDGWLSDVPFAANGELSSPAATDSASTSGPAEASEDAGAPAGDPPVPEVPAASAQSGCAPSDSAAQGAGEAGAGSTVDPAPPGSADSPALEAPKSRQPGGGVEPRRQPSGTGSETLPSGYVPFLLQVLHSR